jgi:hypothetical protein
MKDLCVMAVDDHATISGTSMPSGDLVEHPAAYVLQALATNTTMMPNYQDSVIGFLDVDPTKIGLGSVEFRIPFEDMPASGTDVKPAMKTKHDSGLSTTIMPAGSISLFHMDSIGAHQMVYHYSGKKLWIMAEQTDENTKMFYDMASGRRCATLEQALAYIYHLRPMTALIVDKPVVFLMPKNCIHAVLTIDSVALHTTFAYWRSVDAEDTISFLEELLNLLGAGAAENQESMLNRMREAVAGVAESLPPLPQRRQKRRRFDKEKASGNTCHDRIAMIRERLTQY